MGPWGAIGGAVLGGLGGAMAKRPQAYTPYQTMTDPTQRSQFSGQVLNSLQGWATGNKPLMSQAQINEQTSGARGRLAANQQAERMRINERALGRQGRMGGMQEASMAALGREGLGQQRQLEAGVQNQLAQETPQMAMEASKTGLGFVQGQENNAMDEYHRQMQAAAARQQFSKWGNILGGMTAGLGVGSSMMGRGGGGGGGQMAFSPSYGQAPAMPGGGYSDMSLLYQM